MTFKPSDPEILAAVLNRFYGGKITISAKELEIISNPIMIKQRQIDKETIEISLPDYKICCNCKRCSQK
jgi:hypothetical protein